MGKDAYKSMIHFEQVFKRQIIEKCSDCIDLFPLGDQYSHCSPAMSEYFNTIRKLLNISMLCEKDLCDP